MDQTLTPPSLIQLLRLLVTQPRQVVLAVENKIITPERAFLMTGVLVLLFSLMFAVSTLLHQPAEMHWIASELAVRFGFSLLVAGISLVLLIGFWSILQKLTSWYWDAPLTLLNAVLFSGLGVGYYTLAILLGLGILALPTFNTVSEVALFTLNAGAFLLLLRLFYTVYRGNNRISRKKAVFITLFPLFMVALTYSATQLLTYFAMMPHLRGGGAH
jgi:hypothetical protein